MTAKPPSIAEEIQQGRPFPSLEEEAGIALLRTAEVLKTYFGSVVEPAGVSLPQYNVLRILRGAGPEGLPILSVAERMIERAPGMTRMIDRLEKKGLVVRERCATDRRIVYARITPAGKAVVDGLDDAVTAAHVQGFPPLDRDEIRAFVRVLDALRASHEVSNVARLKD